MNSLSQISKITQLVVEIGECEELNLTLAEVVRNLERLKAFIAPKKVMKYQLDADGNRMGEGVPVPNTFEPHGDHIKRSSLTLENGVWNKEVEVPPPAEEPIILNQKFKTEIKIPENAKVIITSGRHPPTSLPESERRILVLPPAEKETECEECGETFHLDDLTLQDDDFYCGTCLYDKYVRCEMCEELFDIEEGDWVRVKYDQPFRKTKTCSGVILRDFCLECVQDNIEDFIPDFKTDKFVFEPRGSLCEDNLLTVVEEQKEMVSKMKWCERCDICPQDEDNWEHKNWCSECYFQHGAEDDHEDCECCGEPGTAGLHNGRFECIACREYMS